MKVKLSKNFINWVTELSSLDEERQHVYDLHKLATTRTDADEIWTQYVELTKKQNDLRSMMAGYMTAAVEQGGDE